MDPRDDGGRLPASVVGMIVDSLKRVEESVTRLSTDMHEQMSRLPSLYVPRLEVDRRFDEHTIDLGELRAALAEKRATHDADIRSLEEDIERVEARRKADEAQRQGDRRWLLATFLTVLGLVVAMVALMARTA